MCEEKWSRSWSRSSEPARAGSEKNHSALVVDAEWCGSSDGKPSDVKVRYFLTQLREELGRIRKALGPSDNCVTLALGSVCNLERYIAAQEKKSQEAARPPEASETVVQQISALRKSLEDKSPQEIKDSSSKEEEYILVAPIKGVCEDGRLILGDRKILSAKALKI